MPGERIRLTYAPPSREHRHFHIFLLPLLWLPAAVGSRLYAEEFRQMLVFFPAVPLIILLQDNVGSTTLLATTTILNIAVAFTLLIVIGAGHVLDHNRAPRWIHFAFVPILLVVMASRIFDPKFRTGLQSIPPPPLPPSWHPSNLFPTWAWTLYLFAIAAILLTALIRGSFGQRSMA